MKRQTSRHTQTQAGRRLAAARSAVPGVPSRKAPGKTPAVGPLNNEAGAGDGSIDCDNPEMFPRCQECEYGDTCLVLHSAEPA